MKRFALLVVVLAMAGILSGCLTISGGAAPSTKPVEPGDYTSVGRTSGDSWGFSLLHIIPIKLPNTQSAIEEAQRNAGSDLLTDVTVDTQMFFLCCLTIERYKVRGNGANYTPEARRKYRTEYVEPVPGTRVVPRSQRDQYGEPTPGTTIVVPPAPPESRVDIEVK